MNGYTLGSITMVFALIFALKAGAEETTIEKAGTAVNKATDSVKETYRDAKDKGCEMVNGKMKCLGKKVSNKAKTLKDKTETKVEEIKDKVD